MSSSIAIPTPPPPVGQDPQQHHHRRHHRPTKTAMASSSTSSLSTPMSSVESSSPRFTSPSSSGCSASPSRSTRPLHQRRPSLLSSSISQEEAHVINIGDPDGPPRLISFLTSSQGFTWNPEIFVPSYIDCEYTPLENRREPVHEIFLTDEEAKNMFPK